METQPMVGLVIPVENLGGQIKSVGPGDGARFGINADLSKVRRVL